MRIEFSARADKQLRTINRYVARASTPAIAEAFVARIVHRCLRIANVPLGGSPREDLGRGMRSVPFEHSATILYRVRGETIVIAAVFYRGQDIAARLRRLR